MVLRQVHDSTLAGDVLLIITKNWWENIPFRHGVLVTDVIPYLIKGYVRNNLLAAKATCYSRRSPEIH